MFTPPQTCVYTPQFTIPRNNPANNIYNIDIQGYGPA